MCSLLIEVFLFGKEIKNKWVRWIVNKVRDNKRKKDEERIK